MIKKRTTSLAAICLLTVLSAGCGEKADEPGEMVDAPPLTDEAISGELPAGHPPIAQAPAGSGMEIVQPPAGSGTGDTGLAWQVPAGWMSEEPSSAMRKAQYKVPGEAGDAECVIFYFGPGQGGDAMANALRWADQFSQPDGSSSREAMTTEEIGVGAMKVLLSEVKGTYSGGMTMMGGPSENLEGYMLLGAVAEGPDANWFFKLTGPEATVEAQRNAFRAMVESLESGS